jgi:hypothetical protein
VRTSIGSTHSGHAQNKIFFSGCASDLHITLYLCIVQWSHFSFMIISLAQLGFAASGSYLALLEKKYRNHYSQLFFINTLFFSISCLLCFLVAEHIPFNALTFIWDPKQTLYLAGIYLTLGIPFFLLQTVSAYL